MNKEEKALVDEVLRKYKIPAEHVLGARAYPQIGETVVVTKGGKRVRHRAGEDAQFELSCSDITGELPPDDQEMFWDEKASQGRRRSEIQAMLKSKR
jgi:hypothetical protein